MKFQLDSVSFSYKSKAFSPCPVFSDLSLVIQQGECVLIVGEEGSGKSTLLRLLNGLQKPDGGTVLVNEKNIWTKVKELPSLRRRIGFAFQFPEQQFFCECVKDELVYASRNFGISISDDAILAALAMVGLTSDVLSASPFALSAGDARRVALASLLVAQPDAFLLDEPTASLDGFGIAMVQALVAALKAKEKTIVIVSHQAPVFLPLVDRVALLENGAVAHEHDPMKATSNTSMIEPTEEESKRGGIS